MELERTGRRCSESALHATVFACWASVSAASGPRRTLLACGSARTTRPRRESAASNAKLINVRESASRFGLIEN
jgi:hypothetical protein